jgi:hypothetical protein
MSRSCISTVALLVAVALAPPPPVFAQATKPVPAAQTEQSEFNIEQLDALLAPIALYPDELLTQLLMASTYPLQVVAAGRWLEKDENKNLKDDALTKALERETWDPSVKSLVPFPQIVAMLNENLEWTEQLSHAVATQQAAVLDSVQRLRRQAQETGSLKSGEQQRVEVRDTKIIIEPARTDVVYVPMYKPAEVYGTWPYPSYPPVYLPPPAAYYPPGYAFGAGLAFATGVAVVGRLWGWANPGWNNGNVTVNPLQYNQINVNRTQIQSNTWRAPTGTAAQLPARATAGPVGAPAKLQQLPTNAIGRNNVQVPANAVNRPRAPSQGTTPGQTRANAGTTAPTAQRPAQPPAALRPATAQRPATAFGGTNDGNRAGQFEARGAQSRNLQQTPASQGRAAGGGLRRR